MRRERRLPCCPVGLGGFCFVLLSFVPTSFVGMEVLVLLALRVRACMRVCACVRPSLSLW